MLEKFLRFVNRNAYILCAINGTGFCKSASDAFSLLLRNAVRVAVLDKVTDIVLFISRLVIVTIVGILSFYVFTNRIQYINEYLPPTNYYMVPIITICVGAYFISGLVFSVYNMAIDTIFLCFRKFIVAISLYCFNTQIHLFRFLCSPGFGNERRIA